MENDLSSNQGNQPTGEDSNLLSLRKLTNEMEATGMVYLRRG